MNPLKLKKTALFIVCFAITIIISSCGKKTVAPAPEPAPANGTLFLHLHTNVDTNEVDTYVTSTYTMTGGRKISVNISQLYVSNIQLVKSDGTFYDVPNTYLLKTMQVEQYQVGGVPPGNYNSINFTVGLPVATNALTPALNDSTLGKTNMWFGVTAQPLGYIFMNFQGKIDTSTAGNGTLAQMQPFIYRIGTNAHLKSVSMPTQNYTIVSNQATYIHIVIDYNKLFTGITLHTPSNLIVNTSSDNASALAAQITNNIPLMFHYEY